MGTYCKKILTMAVLIMSICVASWAFAGCPTAVTSCYNTASGNVPAGGTGIPANATCSDYYIMTGGTPNTTTTYCSNCGACIAGASDCIKGALGCKQCNISNGTVTYHGVACAGSPNACGPNPQETNYSCTN